MTVLMLNGELVPADQAMVPALDRGLTHGLGLYETLKLVGGYPVFFDEHMTRLDKGLAQLDLQMPGARADLARQMVRLSKASEVPNGACRVLVTGGPPAGDPTVLMQTEARGAAERPLVLISYRALRSTADLKSKTFTTSWLAQRAAHAAGADDALFVDEEGRAHEATTANLFLFIRQELRTPPVDGSILPGVVRAQIMDLAAGAGIPVRKAHIRVEELAPCDTLMLTSSVRGIAVAASIDGAVLNTGAPIVEKLRGLLRKAEEESAAAFRAAYGA